MPGLPDVEGFRRQSADRGRPLESIRLAGRRTVLCPHCQTWGWLTAGGGTPAVSPGGAPPRP
ncbi:zinc finger domain-containing protein [Streptomyces sp. NPDC079167]|uniref:zinc finger domain-containing protein n=1 Tax=Streptomyces sp. NPDC079167 TaxID=3154513 RepID=UPI003429D529